MKLEVSKNKLEAKFCTKFPTLQKRRQSKIEMLRQKKYNFLYKIELWIRQVDFPK